MVPKHIDQSDCSFVREGGDTAGSDDSDDDIIQTECYHGTCAGGGTTVVGGASAEGGYECKYCSFQTTDLKLFTAHVDSEHPTIVTNTSYVCVECDYSTKSYDTLQVHNARCHPGEDSFTRTMVTRNNQTIFQQTVNDLTFDGSFVKTEEGENPNPAHSSAHITLSHTPIMRRSSPLPPADVIKVESDEEEDYDSKEMPVLSPAPITPLTPVTPVTPIAPVAPRLVTANPSITMNGSSIQLKGGGGVGGGVLAPGTLAQVLTALQGQTQSSSSQTQLLIPVSSIPTYSPSMDHNLLLISAFNRFPYPSVAEILGLSSQTKFSEEQIKVWFSAQRLKHGVSWTPEEVEEARHKKLNGAVQAPPTITVIPANGLQSLFQTCHGLVLTQLPANGSALPVTLTVTPPATQPAAQSPASDPAHAQTKTDNATAADNSPNKPKKSKEQLAELKASYGRRPFATEAEISRLMQVTKLSKRAIKKWFSDTRYNQRNSRDHHSLPPPDTTTRAGSRTIAPGSESRAAIIIDSSDETDSSPSARDSARLSRSRSPAARSRHAFPDFTLQKFKEKTPEQRVELEQSFQRSAEPSDEELSRLRAATKLTLRELHAWFSDRRRLPQDGNIQLSSEAASPSSSEPAASEPIQQRTLFGSRRAVKKSPEQLHTLKRAFVRSQWPTAAEYDRLSADTGLPRSDIVNWFGDARYSAKNSALKWYFLYHSGKGDEALNGGSKKKPRKRFRGWSRRRRPRRSPTDTTVVKVKSGRWFLKDYFLRHRALSESDLDELVSKSGLSYEQVRDWFQQVQSREEQGLRAFQSSEEEEQAEDSDEDKGEESAEPGEGAEEEEEEPEKTQEQEENVRSEEEEDQEETNQSLPEEESSGQSQPVSEQT